MGNPDENAVVVIPVAATTMIRPYCRAFTGFQILATYNGSVIRVLVPVLLLGFELGEEELICLVSGRRPYY